MLERYLIEHCSPTLASLKTASLFNVPFLSRRKLYEQLIDWNKTLGEKGVTLHILRQCDQSALVYVCRKKKLQEDLKKPGVARFLLQYGYEKTDVQVAIQTLKKRLENSEGFPHEIGIFLGYPLGDVMGFIKNAGRNSKCVGCWKVYCNECEAIKLFARFKKCKDVYARLWNQGRTVWQLTVAV